MNRCKIKMHPLKTETESKTIPNMTEFEVIITELIWAEKPRICFKFTVSYMEHISTLNTNQIVATGTSHPMSCEKGGQRLRSIRWPPVRFWADKSLWISNVVRCLLVPGGIFSHVAGASSSLKVDCCPLLIQKGNTCEIFVLGRAFHLDNNIATVEYK